MPLYEYRCKSCGNRFEKIQKVTDAPETACPKCGGELVRPLTAPAFQFKGAGWYVNDYASKPSGGSSSETAKSESTAGSGSGTESKPAAESKPASTESRPASSKSDS